MNIDKIVEGADRVKMSEIEKFLFNARETLDQVEEEVGQDPEYDEELVLYTSKHGSRGFCSGRGRTMAIVNLFDILSPVEKKLTMLMLIDVGEKERKE